MKRLLVAAVVVLMCAFGAARLQAAAGGAAFDGHPKYNEDGSYYGCILGGALCISDPVCER